MTFFQRLRNNLICDFSSLEQQVMVIKADDKGERNALKVF